MSSQRNLAPRDRPLRRRRPLPRATLRELTARAVVASRRLRSTAEDLTWAASVLTDPERALWARLPPYEQDHAVQVARKVERRLAPTMHGAEDRWIAAALLHDVGKLESDLSRFERVAGTLASRVVNVATARRWASSARGFRRRVGAYLIHGEIGARLIREAGGREEVARWAEVHEGYRDVAGSGLPAAVVEALIASDVA
jgi:hypothetical protein